MVEDPKHFSLSSPAVSHRRVLVVFCCTVVVVSGISAQAAEPSTNSPTPTKPTTNQPPIRSIPVRVVSPVESFQELLAMSPAQREKALAAKTADKRQAVVDKIKEYEAMSPEERELRLRVTSLRWHVGRLIELPPHDRVKSLASTVPEEDRPLVESRLKLWDEVSPHLQKEFLRNAAIIDDLIRLEKASPAQQKEFLKTFPSDRRQKLEREMAIWAKWPEEKRQEMCQQFGQFFELTEAERNKTLGILTDQERAQMEMTLKRFESLPPSQRTKCIDSFRKFIGMSQDERNQFLKNAERWQTMTPSEREAWRDIVRKTAPAPPAPPLFPPMPASFVVSTNRVPR